MPIHITTQMSGETCLRALPADGASLTPFPDAGLLQSSGCFSSVLFYDQHCPDFSIRLSNYVIGTDKGWPHMADDRPVWMLQFVLKNTLHFTMNGDQSCQMTEGQYHLLTAPSIASMDWFDLRNQHTSTLDIYLSHDFLKCCSTGMPGLTRMLESKENPRASLMSETPATVNPVNLHFLNAMLTCPYTGELRRHYLQTKVFLLLVMAHDQFFGSSGAKSAGIQLNRYELEKIHEARQYMRQHIENPPTLKELARKVGINDFKLKKAYKQVFHTTIFDDFNQYRMEKAMQSLLETDMTIADISLSTGYEDPPNFIRAFKRYVGTAPSIFRKQHGR